MRILPSSDESNGEEQDRKTFEMFEAVVSNEEEFIFEDSQQSKEEILSVLGNEADDPFLLDPVENFTTDQEDNLSQVSNFSKESIHEFSQSETQTQSQTQSQIQSQIIETDDDCDHIILDEPSKLELIESSTVEPIFVLDSQKLFDPTVDSALESADKIIRQEMDDFAIWEFEVNKKILEYGSVVNAFHSDDSVTVLSVNKSWEDCGLVFAKCSVMKKEEIDSMIQTIPKQLEAASKTKMDTIQEFPEKLSPPPIPIVSASEEATTFIFSFAMCSGITIDGMKECKLVAVWEPTTDFEQITLDQDGGGIPTNTSTITRFKIIA